MRNAIFVGMLLMFSTTAAATSLKDFWASRPADDPHFPSSKSMGALEECLALEISEKAGMPFIIHGEHQTTITGVMMSGYVQMPVGGSRIVDHGSSREIFVGAIHTGGWRNKISALVQQCV